jgi:SAM-dependent methyltransferase
MGWPFEIAERDHDIQNPLSREKIERLGEYMRLGESSQVLDLGCGKAGPAIVLAEHFGCRVTGVEVRAAFADDARTRIASAGLESRITIETADAKTYATHHTFDAAICLGASFIWGHIGDAAARMKPTVRPGGFIAIGEPFWRIWPLPDEIETHGYVGLPDTVARFEETGLQLVGLIASSQDDWDHYESLHWRAIEEWLADRPDDPHARSIRTQHEQFRLNHLRNREHLGWAVFVGRRRET